MVRTRCGRSKPGRGLGDDVGDIPAGTTGQRPGYLQLGQSQLAGDADVVALSQLDRSVELDDDDRRLLEVPQGVVLVGYLVEAYRRSPTAKVSDSAGTLSPSRGTPSEVTNDSQRLRYPGSDKRRGEPS
jgi:hypothetical protein